MKAAGAAPKARWWWGKEWGEREGGGEGLPWVSQANKTGEWARASGDPPSMRRSDTVSTEDKGEEDRENKNYGEEKLWGGRAAVREAVKYKVGGVINATFHSFIRPPPTH